jgi:hypothetical protein
MNRGRTGRKTPDFGKRVSEPTQSVRKPASMERLKTMGRRWWSEKAPRKKHQPGRKASGT